MDKKCKTCYGIEYGHCNLLDRACPDECPLHFISLEMHNTALKAIKKALQRTDKSGFTIFRESELVLKRLYEILGIVQ